MPSNNGQFRDLSYGVLETLVKMCQCALKSLMSSLNGAQHDPEPHTLTTEMTARLYKGCTYSLWQPKQWIFLRTFQFSNSCWDLSFSQLLLFSFLDPASSCSPRLIGPVCLKVPMRTIVEWWIIVKLFIITAWFSKFGRSRVLWHVRPCREQFNSSGDLWAVSKKKSRATHERWEEKAEKCFRRGRGWFGDHDNVLDHLNLHQGCTE